MYNFRVKGSQSQEADVDKLKHFGIPSGDVTFEVVRLDGDHMVLRSGGTSFVFSFLLIFPLYMLYFKKKFINLQCASGGRKDFKMLMLQNSRKELNNLY